MSVELPTKRAIAFVDGQNLLHAAKEAFGFRHPNFDPDFRVDRVFSNSRRRPS